jgi:murein DD-endopeptidase MepM/ murein hydrolase activator NlpD
MHIKQGSVSKQNLRVGSYVKAGQIIALSGHNGNSTAPHLHVEVNQNKATGMQLANTIPFAIDWTGNACKKNIFMGPIVPENR